jgi:hypothetical protein
MDKKVTLRDYNQINAHEHQEDLNAKRVVIVGGELPEFNISNIKIPDIKIPDFEVKTIEIPTIIIQKELQIEQVPVIVKEFEIKEIEKPVIIVQKELQIERVEIPVVQKELEIIEKPVIIKEVEYKDLPSWVKVLLVAQALISIITLLKK